MRLLYNNKMRNTTLYFFIILSIFFQTVSSFFFLTSYFTVQTNVKWLFVGAILDSAVLRKNAVFGGV